ncbi:hypothetical protein A4G20_01555 [Pasteurellaceae bacterium RH1A]|nr:hypothetical protein A4G20_01555 [Pasteurellaceae bacterium RH1A]
MQKTLIISGHPDLSQSIANKTIIETLQNQAQGTLLVRDLAKQANAYQFDLAQEQAALLAADTIVLQFPFYWYSAPALLKKWIDDVFAFGFAYGEGARLAGKSLLVSCTVGGREIDYSGQPFRPVGSYLQMFEDTAKYCGLNWLEPIYSFDMYPEKEEDKERVRRLAKAHAERLIKQLNL